jgi:carboxyl-terminal processing protease
MSRSKLVALAGALLWLLTTPVVAGDASEATPPTLEVAPVPDVDSFDKNMVLFTQVLGLVRQVYVDEPGNGLMPGAIAGVTDALDPFSTYVPAAEVDGYLEAQKVGWRHSGAVVVAERGIAYVVAIERGGPADRAGIQQGDIVAEVNDRSTRLMPPWEIEELFAAKPGTTLDLKLVHRGEAREVSLVLWPFTSPPPSLETSGAATVLRIPTFDAATAPAVKELLADAAGITELGLVVDLRGVATGDPQAAYATAALFTAGYLGGLTHRQDERQAFASDQPPVWHGRLVVLVDRGTLGAAEILATVLRQKASAELVGERTFGYAGSPGDAELSGGGRLFYTEAFYTGPDRRPLRESLLPDVVVDERSRTLLEQDVPMADLILDRGTRRLLGSGEARP